MVLDSVILVPWVGQPWGFSYSGFYSTFMDICILFINWYFLSFFYVFIIFVLCFCDFSMLFFQSFFLSDSTIIQNGLSFCLIFQTVFPHPILIQNGFLIFWVHPTFNLIWLPSAIFAVSSLEPTKKWKSVTLGRVVSGMTWAPGWALQER